MLERDTTATNTTVSLSAEINAATRYNHTILNRLITSRLPLALPPHAADSSLYATGLLHFAHVFLTFESLWADPTAPPTSPLLSYLLVNPYDSPSFFTSTLGAPTPPSPQLAAFLQTLRPRGLMRSVRVKRDLEYLMGLHPTDLEVLLAKYPGSKVAEFCAHIRKSVHQKPWTLVSYAWCFYMAVFSGGRWIRAGLLEAGPQFWQKSDEDEQTAMSLLTERGLAFWHFPGQFDGEDIKLDFKARLAAADTLFTPDERVDIIEEAKNIMQLCATLVEELDDMVGTDSAGHASNRSDTTVGTTTGTDYPDVQEKSLFDTKDSKAADLIRVATTSKSQHRIVDYIRQPKVMGSIVALTCFACVALSRLQ
ncbi:hypothetical protein GQ44DRAFT_709196 [Phaeosphaeriaceae sp. PMI808]|nr:hypothetical protein GQ44DRAFT_709196 [Phaeosphaeriaceae sp. PMI808]